MSLPHTVQLLRNDAPLAGVDKVGVNRSQARQAILRMRHAKKSMERARAEACIFPASKRTNVCFQFCATNLARTNHRPI